jgi:hypothetical protein
VIRISRCKSLQPRSPVCSKRLRGPNDADFPAATNPGDNIPAPVGCRARLAYDDDSFYLAFEFDDPEPNAIRAPLGDRDNVPSSTDYGGVILDARNDGKTAQMFLANARGVNTSRRACRAAAVVSCVTAARWWD